jgi:ABC-type transport system involved in multi-copper enzyme maturation permease subunit
MNPAAAALVLRCLVRDTFRQSFANGVFWLMLAVSVLTAGACLTVNQRTTPATEAHPNETAHVDLLFGLARLDVDNPRAHPMRTLQLQLAGWVADAAGLILALLWTSSFLPSFLAPSTATVLLAKPPPRWLLVAGKYLGVVLFVGLQTTVFIGTTWLALAARTGFWDARYLLCIPLLVLHFAVFYSFSAMLAVATRSTVACAFGSIAFWLLCWTVNFGQHARAIITSFQGVAPTFGALLEGAYWLLPKPLDFHLVLMQTLEAENVFARLLDVAQLTQRGLWHPVASVATSALCGVAILIMAAYDFLTRDY